MPILLPTGFRSQACVQGGARRDPAVPAATPPRLRRAHQRAAARAAGPAPLLCHLNKGVRICKLLCQLRQQQHAMRRRNSNGAQRRHGGSELQDIFRDLIYFSDIFFETN